MNNKVISLIKSQKYKCIAVIVPTISVIRQGRELTSKYGHAQWIVAGRGSCDDLHKLYKQYEVHLKGHIEFHDACSTSVQSTLYLGIKWQV